MTAQLTRISILAVCLVAAACSTQPEAPTPRPGRVGPQQAAATAEAIPWREPVTPITLENATNVQLVGRLDMPGTGTVFAHDFAIDGTRLAGINNDQLAVWDVITSEIVFTASRRDAIDVFFSPDKTELYTIDLEGVVSALEGDSGFTAATFTAHPNFQSGPYAYFPDEGWFVIVSVQGDVRVWDAVQRQAIVNIETLRPEPSAVAFSADGARVGFGTREGITEVWDWESETQIGTLRVEDELPIERVAFSPDGQQLAVATDEDIHVWDLTANAVTNVLVTGRGGSTDILTYTPDGAYIINNGQAEAMNIWGAQSGELVSALTQIGSEPAALAFPPGGDLMLTSVFQGEVGLWDVTSIGTEGVRFAPFDTDLTVVDVAWSPDGRTIALFDTLGSVYVWGIPERTMPTTTDEP
jgi:WD40 repeat protein